MNHEVDVHDGAEYPGEIYIRCSCGKLFDSGHLGLAALLEFLREHEAIS